MLSIDSRHRESIIDTRCSLVAAPLPPNNIHRELGRERYLGEEKERTSNAKLSSIPTCCHLGESSMFKCQQLQVLLLDAGLYVGLPRVTCVGQIHHFSDVSCEKAPHRASAPQGLPCRSVGLFGRGCDLLLACLHKCTVMKLNRIHKITFLFTRELLYLLLCLMDSSIARSVSNTSLESLRRFRTRSTRYTTEKRL